MDRDLRSAAHALVTAAWEDPGEDVSDDTLAANLRILATHIGKAGNATPRRTDSRVILQVKAPDECREGAPEPKAVLLPTDRRAAVLAATKRFLAHLVTLPEWQIPTPEQVDALVLVPLPSPDASVVSLEKQMIQIVGGGSSNGNYLVRTPDGEVCPEFVARSIEQARTDEHLAPGAKVHHRHVLLSLMSGTDPSHNPSRGVCAHPGCGLDLDQSFFYWSLPAIQSAA
jgi:hypothetical protein